MFLHWLETGKLSPPPSEAESTAENLKKFRKWGIAQLNSVQHSLCSKLQEGSSSASFQVAAVRTLLEVGKGKGRAVSLAAFVLP